MFLYIYVNYFALYEPGVIGDILAGVVWEFRISHTLLTVFRALIAVSMLMIVLSVILPARANRVINLAVAWATSPSRRSRESWTFFYGLAVALEVIVLAVVLHFVWTWPRTSSPSTPDLVAPRCPKIQMDR